MTSECLYCHQPGRWYPDVGAYLCWEHALSVGGRP
jgi:hypothetical protein